MTNILEVFTSFLKIGFFGFGGGPSMIPLLQEEIVEFRMWLSPEEFIDALAMGNSLPGPIIIKLAGFIGYKYSGIIGAITAILGVSLPGLLGMAILGFFFYKFKNNPNVQGLFKGIRPVVIAMLLATSWSLFGRSVTDWRTGIIMFVAFFAIAILNIHPIILILLASLFGFFILS